MHTARWTGSSGGSFISFVGLCPLRNKLTCVPLVRDTVGDDGTSGLGGTGGLTLPAVNRLAGGSEVVICAIAASHIVDITTVEDFN